MLAQEDPHVPPMTVEELAEELREAGAEHATPEAIRADIAAGAPVNEDGTLDPVAYAAWLAARRP
jgi:hypothetical protein